MRISIYGSCVSRDAVDSDDRERFVLAQYIARSSLLSWGTDARPMLPGDLGLTSPFQVRNVTDDAGGNLTERLAEHLESSDVLLWDLTDERHGVVRFVGGEVMTRTVEALTSQPLQALLECGEIIPFGSDRHFHAWCHKADMFTDFLRSHGALRRTLVVGIPWALSEPGGAATPPSMGIAPDLANVLYGRYYNHLEALGYRLITVQKPRADLDHRWGFAPFHYEASVYSHILDEVETLRNPPR